MRDKKGFIGIIVAVLLLAIIVVIVSLNPKWPRTIRISEQYANMLEDVKQVKKIEIRNGSTGEGLVIDGVQSIQEIKSLIYDVKLTKDLNQSKRTGYLYTIKCYKDTPQEEWFVLTIGGSLLSDSTRGQSPYYNIENHEDLVEMLDAYFKHPKMIDVYRQIDEVRDDILNVELFSGLTGERISITARDEINKMVDAMKDVLLERYDMGGETKAGYDFSVHFNLVNGYYSVVYGGDTFSWYRDLNQKQRQPEYKLVEQGKSFYPLKAYLKQ